MSKTFGHTMHRYQGEKLYRAEIAKRKTATVPDKGSDPSDVPFYASIPVPGMTLATITCPDGTVEEYNTTCPLPVYMWTVDPHDFAYWIDEDTGLLQRCAPCFHDITRGPLYDSEVRAVCSAFAARIDRVGL